MGFFQWLKNLLSRKKNQQAWDSMYNDTSIRADNLPLDPKNDPFTR